MQFHGVFPALTTKFTSTDELDLRMFAINMDAQIKAGVSGLVLGGTLGEASVLSLSEKQELVKFAVQYTDGRVHIVMNIAEGATREAVRQAQLAAEWGASGLMLLPPMRYRSDHQETVKYFRDVASSTSLPIMLYNNPVDYRTEITMQMFDELQSEKNIVAVKESTRDTSNITRMINRFGNRYQILSGVDTLALESLLLGAHGWVAGLVCAFPEETVRLYHLAMESRLNEANELNRWFMPLLELDIHPKLVQYIKLAEAETGLGTEYVRLPRLPLSGTEREEVLTIIRTAIEARKNIEP